MSFLIKIQETTRHKSLGIIRVAVGILFVSTGAMKLLVPMLKTAWSDQLIAANIPFYTFNFWLVPFLEIIVGLFLLVGFFTRIASLTVIGIMIVATYVHIVVNDPTLFPLQPEAPIIPVVVIILTASLLIRGGGAWSKDLQSSHTTRKG